MASIPLSLTATGCIGLGVMILSRVELRWMCAVCRNPRTLRGLNGPHSSDREVVEVVLYGGDIHVHEVQAAKLGVRDK
jgi:hypothetical protein